MRKRKLAKCYYDISSKPLTTQNKEKLIALCKVLPKRFHLNGHTTGFCQQTQKLELHYMSQSILSMGVKGSMKPQIQLLIIFFANFTVKVLLPNGPL